MRRIIHPTCSDIMEAIMVYHAEEEIAPSLIKQLLFLADWRHIQQTGQLLSGLRWSMEAYGPYAKEMYEVIMADPKWDMTLVESPYGIPKRVIRLRSGHSDDSLPITGRVVIEGLMMETRDLSYMEVYNLVCDTLPVKESQRGHPMDLHRFVMNKEV